MHRTYIEFISTCDVCLIFSLRCISHLCRHAVYIALVECHIHRIWSLRVLHPPELQSDSCWMQYKLHSGQCDVYLIFKHLIYVSFLESHLCRIRYHMRRMSHLLIAINTASASICRAGGAGCVECGALSANASRHAPPICCTSCTTEVGADGSSGRPRGPGSHAYAVRPRSGRSGGSGGTGRRE